MSRRRYLSTDISTDAAVNRLAMRSDFAALLYTWMIPHCGDDASLPGDAEEILMKVMPGRRDKSPDDVESALELMQQFGLIVWRRDEKTVDYPAPAFYRYQSYIKDGDRRGKNNTAQPREIDTGADNSANQRTTAQNDASFKSSFSSSVLPSGGSPPVVPQSPPAPPALPPPKEPKPRTERQKAADEVYERKMVIVSAYFRGLSIEEGTLPWTQRKGRALSALTAAVLNSPECVPEIVEPLTKYTAAAFRWRNGKKIPDLSEVLMAFAEWDQAGRPDDIKPSPISSNGHSRSPTPPRLPTVLQPGQVPADGGLAALLAKKGITNGNAPNGRSASGPAGH